MDVKPPASKRSRKALGSFLAESSQNALTTLLTERQWDKALLHVAQHAQDAACPSVIPSPLALACRYGAPHDCVQAILEAAPRQLRVLIDARGTPLHEAIGCTSVGLDVIEMLVQADEALELGETDTRATLAQDIDGFTPLHVLFRKRFQSVITSPDVANTLLQILEVLVRSCPDAVVVPDHGEYKEPPIVYAVKADTYSFLFPDNDQRVERLIYRMIACLLQHCPKAASWVFTGFRGPYSALHSAVFHGRHPQTIGLLLDVEAEHPSPTTKACLVANSQGETPLHFCAMKGERAKSLALLAQASPSAVSLRDVTGLTPLHWLWFRFVSKLLMVDTLHIGDETTDLVTARSEPTATTRYTDFVLVEREENVANDDVIVGEQDAGPEQADNNSSQLIQEWDRPDDFLRMRHVPLSVLGDEDRWSWSSRSAEVLEHIRQRYMALPADTAETVSWTRREVITSLFWTKVVSLLKAAQQADGSGHCSRDNELRLVHTAFGSPSCCPAVAEIVASLFPQDMVTADSSGRLPVHYAALRQWHAWDWSPTDVTEAVLGQPPDYPPAGPLLLRRESLAILRTALELSPPQALGIADNDGRLVLHYVIDTFVQATAGPAMSRSTDSAIKNEMLETLHNVVRRNPVALQRRDGVTKLYPFMQAAAGSVQNDVSLSMTYQLLRENPTILQTDRHRAA